MDRAANPPERSVVRVAIGGRLRQVRRERYGDEGGARLASLLRLPPRTWENYERGVAIPGEIVLEFLAMTGIEPLWLLSGGGQMYRATAETAGHGDPA